MDKVYNFRAFVFEKLTHETGPLPKGRSGHRIVCNNKELYTYGGYNPDFTYSELANLEDWVLNRVMFREVWKYNFAQNSWKKVAVTNIPIVFASNAVILEGNLMMIYGGTGVPFGVQCSNTLYVCNLLEEVLNFKAVMGGGNIPQPQYGQAIFLYKKFLYVIGGTTGYEFSCDVHRLDLVSGIWELIHLNTGLPGEPAGRYRHEIGLQIHKDKVYIFGGGTSQHSFDLKNLPTFDLQLNKWSSIATVSDPLVKENSGYPKGRKFHCLVQARTGSDVFIAGGESNSEFLSDFWKISLDTLQWRKISTLTFDTPRYFHAATLTPEGKIYIYGGIISAKRTSDMLAAWLCIPPLQEICWEAVLFYKILDNLPKNGLKQFLPPRFINRLE